MYTPFMERWKSVPGWEGRYSVSNLGRIRRDCPGKGTRAGRMLKPSPSGPYVCVGLSDRRGGHGRLKCVRVHLLVCAAFRGPCPRGYEVNHENGDHRDNRLHNLSYVTHAENVRHANAVLGRQRGARNHRALLTDGAVRRVLSLRMAGLPYRQIAEKCGVTPGCIACICRRENWQHVGFSRRFQNPEVSRDAYKGERNGRAKLSATDVRTIRDLRRAGATQRSVAQRFGVCGTTIQRIMDGRGWSHLV